MDFDQILSIVITTVLVPLLTWGISVLIKFLNAKIENLQNATMSQALLDATMELQRAVKTAVLETQQTFVDALKADGAFTKEDAKLAFQKSFDRAKEIMSNSGMTIIEGMTGALNAMITAEIEKTVGQIK